jgi:hypothetical protein
MTGVAGVLPEAAVYGAVTLAISLTARGFRLYNLASGFWVLIGGWLWCALADAPGGQQVDLRWGWVIACVGALQVALPILQRRQLIHNQIAYALGTVGVALILGGVVPALFLQTSSALIGVQATAAWDAAAVAAAVIVGMVSIAVVHSKWYARTSLSFRIDGGARIGASLLALVTGEIVLLAVLGAASATVHRGVFESSLVRSIIPVLALLMTGRRPLFAAAVAGGIPIAAHVVGRAVPTFVGVSLPVTIGIFGVVALVSGIATGRRAATSAQEVRLPAPRTWAWGNPGLRGAVSILLIGAVLLVMGGLRSPNAMNTAWMASLFVSGFLVLGYLRVFTVSVPVVGSLGALIWYALSDWPFALAVGLGLLAAVWIAYLYGLRRMREDHAVVADLALMLAVIYWTSTARAIYGPDGVRLLAQAHDGLAPDEWVATILVVAATGIATTYVSSALPWLRTRVVALLAGASGRGHGAPGQLNRGIAASLAAGISIVGSLAYYRATGAIAASSVSLERGLAVMVLASLALRLEPALASVAVVGLYAVIAGVYPGAGTLVHAALGLGLVGVVCLPSASSGERP